MSESGNDPDRQRRGLRLAPQSGDVVPSRARRARERDEGPSDEDIERFGDVTRTCPECGKQVFDDAAVCYHCGHAFEEREDAKGTAKWVVVTIVVLIAGFVAAVFSGLF